MLDGLPKYDSLGYEIKYFAVEHTSVNASDFDYLPVEYSVPVAENEGHIASIGTEYEISSPDGMNYVRNVQTQENSDVPYYALIEAGYFYQIRYIKRLLYVDKSCGRHCQADIRG